jgi:phosphoglycerate dehydrogenase-like enzyme
VTRILVTPRSLTAEGGAGLERLTAAGHEIVLGPRGRQPTEEELLELLPGCAGYLAGAERITGRVLERAGGLRVISRNGTGTDQIDVAAAAERGIAVERAIAANAPGVAELALTMVLAGLRRVPPMAVALAEGRWERLLGRELADVRLGVVGAGAIGRRLLELAAAVGVGSALAADVRPAADLRLPTGVRVVALDALLRASDVVSLHCPPLPDGRPVVAGAELELLASGTVLVNTARAELVDEEAVLDALDSGRLALYATDVFRSEPPPPSPLLRHPRVLATPHVGGYTDRSIARATDAAVDRLLEHLGGAG